VDLAYYNTLGYAASKAANFYIADEFTITGGKGWYIETMTFYVYQTNAVTLPISGVYVEITQGAPFPASITTLYGDATTNRLANCVFSGIYRVASNVAVTNTQRAVWACTANINTYLPEGTYWWIMSALRSSSFSGPFMPSLVIDGQPNTGISYQRNNGASTAHLTNGGYPIGFPFLISAVQVQLVIKASLFALQN